MQAGCRAASSEILKSENHADVSPLDVTRCLSSSGAQLARTLSLSLPRLRCSMCGDSSVLLRTADPIRMPR